MNFRLTAASFISFCVLTGTTLAGTNAARGQAPTATDETPSMTASLRNIEVTSVAHGLAIKISTSVSIEPTVNELTNPARLALDFSGCELSGTGRHMAVDRAPVKEVRASQFTSNPPVVRVVVDLTASVRFEVKQTGDGIVLITIPFSTEAATMQTSAAPASASSQLNASPTENSGAPPNAAANSTITTDENKAPGAYTLMSKARELGVSDLQDLEDKANAGDPEAETTLALAYYAGKLLKKNDAEALRLLHLAADRNYRAAEESLGIFAEVGVGTGQASGADALHWYQKAAEQGSLDAETNIALMYANGRGVPKDEAQALTWFRRAADAGESSAEYNLALMYERGQGVTQDYKEAMRWLTAAADQNLVPALLDLGQFYLQPPSSAIKADVNKAVEYYKKAANLGSAPAQSTLGTIFTRGMTGNPDYDQAVDWYRKAAGQGYPDGELGLGVSYALGHGVAVDYEEARRWLAAAAEKGSYEAQYDLGIMCDEGKGGPADRDMAAHYFELAADRGLAKAQYRYGLLLARAGEAGGNGAGGSSSDGAGSLGGASISAASVGTPSHQDRIAAYKWFMLAEDSVKEASQGLSLIRKSMSQQEITEAEKQVDQWRLAHSAKPN